MYRVERLGYSIPAFDFRLPGVTSMSADIHKYGLGIKVCMYQSPFHTDCVILFHSVRVLVLLCIVMRI